MSRCARNACGRWRPGFLVQVGGLGVFLDEAWYCSPRCLEIAVRERLTHTLPLLSASATTLSQPRLGGVLAVQKKLEREVVELAASEQHRTGLRIGSQLVALGVVSKVDVLRALAAQNGVGYLTAVDTARLSSAPGNLSASVVSALRVVPFEADHRHDVLKVACTAPVPRRSLAALRELTGSIIEPYLVSDEQWPALLQAYAAAARRAGATQTPLPTIEAAAAKVADAARTGGSLRMSEARCDDNLWVRLDVGGRIEEFFLTVHDEHSIAEAARAAAEGASDPKAKSRPRKPRAPRPRRPRSTPASPLPQVAEVVTAVSPAAVEVQIPAAAAAVAARPAIRRVAPSIAAAVPVAAAMNAAHEPRPQATAREADLSFIEAWQSRSVPVYER